MSTTTARAASTARSFAILTDVTLCIGCEECVAACKRTNETGEDDAGYGLGWRIEEREGLKFVSHGGGINGWRAFVVRVPAKEIFVAVLTNREGGRPRVSELANSIAERLVEVRGVGSEK